MAAREAQPNIDNQESMILLWSKLIRKTDLNYRLSFPTNFRGVLFSHAKQILPGGLAAEIEVRDVKSQKLRNFVCRTRNGKHPRPVVGGRGWRGFVQENKLEVGDKILFFEEVADDHAIRFGIDVERAASNIKPAAPAGTSTRSSIRRSRCTTNVGLTTLASDEKMAIDMDDVDTTLKLSA